MTLRVLRNTGRVFLECPSVRLMLFSWLGGGYGFVGGRSQRWHAVLNTSYQGYMLLTWVSLMILTLIMWPGLFLSIFSTVKLCPCPAVAFILKESFSGYRILGWHLFFHIPLTISFCCLLISHFLVTAVKILSLPLQNFKIYSLFCLGFVDVLGYVDWCFSSFWGCLWPLFLLGFLYLLLSSMNLHMGFSGSKQISY